LVAVDPTSPGKKAPLDYKRVLEEKSGWEGGERTGQKRIRAGAALVHKKKR